MAKLANYAVGILAAIGLQTSVLAAEEKGWKFKTGYRPDTKAFIDSLPQVPRYRAFLPESVDLSKLLPPIRSQGQQGSCTTWAVGYYMRSYYEGVRQGAPIKHHEDAFSPAFIYNQTREQPGNCEEGTSFEKALRILQQRGIPTLSAFPYSDQNCTTMPGDDVLALAAPYRIRDFRQIRGSVDNIKGQLAQGHVVAAAIVVDDQFQAYRGSQTYNDLSSISKEERWNSGHAMLVVGYDDARQAFRLVNSWGKEWGDKGYMWIAYETFTHRQQERVAYLMDFDDIPAPTPTPVPVPPPVPTPIPPPIVKFDVQQAATRIADLAKAVQCSRIESRVTPEGRVQLTGYAGNREHIENLKMNIARLAGITQVNSDITFRPWPQCEVYYNFDAQLQERRGLKASLAGGGTTLRDGDSLAIEVLSPAYPSYLYVSYLQASGDVVQLSWPQGRFPRAIPPNTRLTFGGGQGGQPIYRVGKPYGDEMVIVVASASPLFPKDVLQSMDDREYLSTFRKMFLAAPKTGGGQRIVSVIALPLQTRAKD